MAEGENPYDVPRKPKKNLENQSGAVRPLGDNDDETKDFRCCFCNKLAIDHCYANCDDLFCDQCYLNHFKQPCPVCGTILETNTQDPDFEIRLQELPVECKFAKYGCREMVKFKNLEIHTKTCKFTIKKLLPRLYKVNPITEGMERLTEEVQSIKETLTKLTENESLQDTTIKEQDAAMQKEVEQMRGEMMQLRETLKESEEKFKMQQENSNSMLNYLLKQDTATLATSVLKLTNDNGLMKTEIRDLRNAWNKSEKAVKNSEQRTAALNAESRRQSKTLKDEHKREIQRLESKIELEKRVMKAEHQTDMQMLETKLVAMFANQQNTLDMELYHRQKDDVEDELKDIFMWKISGFKKKWQRLIMGNANIRIKGEEWFTTQRGLRFKPVLRRPFSLIFIELDFSQDRIPSSPFLHSRKFFLLDQRSAIKKPNVELIDIPQFKRNSAKDTMETSLSNRGFFLACLLEGDNNYVKNDEILIQIILEPISILWKEIESRDGVFLWRIDDYSKKKKDEIDGLKWCLTSKPFKTSHVMGYTAYLQLFLNGCGSEEGKSISISLCFILGENDASLPLPFQCKYEFSLLDQSDSPTKNNVSQEFNHEFKEGFLNRWCVEFVSQSIVETSKYLKNNSILIRTALKML